MVDRNKNGVMPNGRGAEVRDEKWLMDNEGEQKSKIYVNKWRKM